MSAHTQAGAPTYTRSCQSSSVSVSRITGMPDGSTPRRADAPVVDVRMLRAAFRSAFCAWPQATHLKLACASAFPDRHLFRHAWNALAPPAPTRSVPDGSLPSRRGCPLAARIRLPLSRAAESAPKPVRRAPEPSHRGRTPPPKPNTATAATIPLRAALERRQERQSCR